MKNLYSVNDWIDVTEHLRLGEILIESGKINLIQLGMALDIQKFQQMPIGQIFIDMKILDKKDINTALDLQKTIDEIIELNNNKQE
jgi:hypothetical protein